METAVYCMPVVTTAAGLQRAFACMHYDWLRTSCSPCCLDLLDIVAWEYVMIVHHYTPRLQRRLPMGLLLAVYRTLCMSAVDVGRCMRGCVDLWSWLDADCFGEWLNG